MCCVNYFVESRNNNVEVYEELNIDRWKLLSECIDHFGPVLIPTNLLGDFPLESQISQ